MSYAYRNEMRREVCNALGVEVSSLSTDSRSKNISAARATIAAVASLLYGMTKQDAATLAGRKSHSSTNDAINVFKTGKYDRYPICKQYREQCMEVQS